MYITISGYKMKSDSQGIHKNSGHQPIGPYEEQEKSSSPQYMELRSHVVPNKDEDQINEDAMHPRVRGTYNATLS